MESKKSIKSDFITLDQFKDRHYGKRGVKKREVLEAGYKKFKPTASMK